MFWKWLWGFNQGANGKEWRAGKGTLGIIAGCVVGVACVVILVLVNGRDGGRDPESWAWIDVVSSKRSLWSTSSSFVIIMPSNSFQSHPALKVIVPPNVHQFIMSSFIASTKPMKEPRRFVKAQADTWSRLAYSQIYSLGLVKLVITLVKYTPQVMTNYRRQSTMGFSIQQILLDFIGGVLSVLQLVIDSSLQSDWSGLTNNPTKFWLGNFTIFFDLVSCLF